jgi:hypothetical protein
MTTNPKNSAVWEAALSASTFKTKEEASGLRALTAEGNYPNCTINVLDLTESKFRDNDGNVKYQAVVQFECPTSDIRLRRYVTLATYPGSECSDLIRNALPAGVDALKKNIMDINGCRVDVIVAHKVEKGRQVEKWTYIRSSAQAASAKK